VKGEIVGKTILITGGTGSIGSEIAKQALIDKVKKVVIFSRDDIEQFLLKDKLSDRRLQTVVGDVKDIPSIEQVFKTYDIDIIYHAAAMKHVVMCENFPIEAVKTNVLGTQNIVDMAIKYDVPKMITISTDKAVYPANVMGAAKFLAERITLNANTISKDHQIFSCVRFGNVAGSRGSVIPVLMENLMNRKCLEITDREVTRFIMEIPDAVKLIIKSTDYVKGGEIFILKMKAFKLGDMLDVILNRIVTRLGMTKEQINVKEIGLVSGEKLHESILTDGECNRLYKIDNMFVILPDHGCADKYPGISKVNLAKYCSNNVELLSPVEIENMIVKYLNTLRFGLTKANLDLKNAN
jgi:UDP-N-acetylglucosamine 4,6-dehydratase/5-epimerase